MYIWKNTGKKLDACMVRNIRRSKDNTVGEIFL